MAWCKPLSQTCYNSPFLSMTWIERVEGLKEFIDDTNLEGVPDILDEREDTRRS